MRYEKRIYAFSGNDKIACLCFGEEKKEEKRMNQEIGLRIQEVRKKKGLSRGDLADMSGISPKFIFQIEKQGFGFSVDTLMQLTRVLETSYDYLLEGHAEF